MVCCCHHIVTEIKLTAVEHRKQRSRIHIVCLQLESINRSHSPNSEKRLEQQFCCTFCRFQPVSHRTGMLASSQLELVDPTDSKQ